MCGDGQGHVPRWGAKVRPTSLHLTLMMFCFFSLSHLVSFRNQTFRALYLGKRRERCIRSGRLSALSALSALNTLNALSISRHQASSSVLQLSTLTLRRRPPPRFYFFLLRLPSLLMPLHARLSPPRRSQLPLAERHWAGEAEPAPGAKAVSGCQVRCHLTSAGALLAWKRGAVQQWAYALALFLTLRTFAFAPSFFTPFPPFPALLVMRPRSPRASTAWRPRRNRT